MADRLQIRRDTAANWARVNPILRECEIGFITEGGVAVGMKIGDGRVWNALPTIPIKERFGTADIENGAITSEKIAEGVIPTKMSQLTNDAGYTTDAAPMENLLINSRFSNNAEKWEGGGYQVSDNIHGRGVSGVSVDDGNISQRVRLERGWYTLSFFAAGEYDDNLITISGECDKFTSELDGGDGEYILPNTYSPKKCEVSFYCYGDDLDINFEAPVSLTLSEVKLEKSKKASSFTLNTLDIADKYTLPTGGGGAAASISGKLCLNDLAAVKAAMSGLAENEVRFFVITDAEGRIPSTQKCYDVPSDIVREMSLKTGNTLVDGVLKAVEVEPIGVSVGDLIALTKVSVKLSDLAAAVGVSISLSESMLINQYKILHTNGAREENYDEGCTKGVYGLLSPWNKQMIDGSAKPTRWAWGTNLDELLQSGVLAYTSARIEEVSANWTIFVDCSASPDGSGFYHLTQTAYGRDDVNLGDVYTRLGYYQKGEVPTFLPWKKLSV